jgi:hypothetical protein
LQSATQIARVICAKMKSADPVVDQSTSTPAIRDQHGEVSGHRLENRKTERLNRTKMYQTIRSSQFNCDVTHEPGEIYIGITCSRPRSE